MALLEAFVFLLVPQRRAADVNCSVVEQFGLASGLAEEIPKLEILLATLGGRGEEPFYDFA